MNNRAFWFRFVTKTDAESALEVLKNIARKKEYVNYWDISSACFNGRSSDGLDAYAWIYQKWNSSEILKLKVEKERYEWIINFPYPEMKKKESGKK